MERAPSNLFGFDDERRIYLELARWVLSTTTTLTLYWLKEVDELLLITTHLIIEEVGKINILQK